jgi:hypothetical protein
VDAQQLSGKVANLESRVAVLEDEGKIIRGEVKQILTEIRTAVLVRDNPFDSDEPARPQPAAVHVVQAAPEPPQADPLLPAQPHRPEAAASASHAVPPARDNHVQASPAAATAAPRWSLLTVASLVAWAEEAVSTLGTLRLEILLDLCEAAHHISHEARVALSRISELNVPPPAAPSQNDAVVILRQLESLLADDGAGSTGERRLVALHRR